MLLALKYVYAPRNSNDFAEITLRKQVKEEEKTYQIKKLFESVSLKQLRSLRFH